MKLRKSVYQMSYMAMSDQQCREVHETSVAYRKQRRLQEAHHNPVAWDTDSEEECVEKTESVCRSNSPIPEISKQGNESLSTITNDAEIETPDPSAANKLVEIKIPETKKTVKQPRKKPKNIPPIEHLLKPPFVSYGWANKENDLTRKLTHNVKAQTKFVYPAALQKQNRIKSDRSFAKKQAIKRNAAKYRKKMRESTDTSTWETEYQRCYSCCSTAPSTGRK